MRSFFIFSLLLLMSCEVDFLNQGSSNSKANKSSCKNLWSSSLGLEAKISWEQGPYGDSLTESIMTVQFLNKLGVPTALPGHIHLVHYGWMPGMGHGTHSDGTLKEDPVDSTKYITEDFRFNMGGDWDIHLLFCDGPVDGKKCENNEDLVDELICSLYI